MDFRQLEIYVKAYELKSFSKAAEEMFLSQPSISSHISSLEKELQTQLLHRSNREFMPTKAGKLFYENAKEMLSLREKSIVKIKNVSDYTSGSIDILASSVPSQYILPDILSAYHKLFPNVSFNIKQVDTQEVIGGISANISEIGFVGSKIESSKCSYESLISERLLLITPCEKRFENIKQEDIAELLRREYFVMREIGSGTRQEYEEYLHNIGVKASELKVSACFNNTQSVIHAVSGGLGLSIISELAARQYIHNNMIMPIYIDSFPQRHFYMVLKKNYNVSPTVASFVKFIREHKETSIVNIGERIVKKRD